MTLRASIAAHHRRQADPFLMEQNGGSFLVPPSDLDLAYAAGVIDSDGYFSIGRKRGPERAGGRLPNYYDLKVGCNQIGDLIPRWLAETFGVGGVYRCEPNGRSGGWFSWLAQSQKAGTVAEALVPWLRLKREQAEVAVEFCAVLRASRGPITVEVENERAEFFNRMRALNAARGRGSIPHSGLPSAADAGILASVNDKEGT